MESEVQVLVRPPETLSVDSGRREATPSTSVVDARGELDDDLLVEEIRIEDLSIDGMCGVY